MRYRNVVTHIKLLPNTQSVIQKYIINAPQGLETPPRTSTSHLAPDRKCRPPSAQPRTQLSMATCPGQRTMEATRGNGYTPALGSLVMMMYLRAHFILQLLLLILTCNFLM